MPTSRAWQRVSPCKMALSSEYMGRESYAIRFCSSSSVPLHNTSYLGIVAWTALLPAAPGWQSGSPQLVLKDTQSSYCKVRSTYAKYRHHSNQYNRLQGGTPSNLRCRHAITARSKRNKMELTARTPSTGDVCVRRARYVIALHKLGVHWIQVS